MARQGDTAAQVRWDQRWNHKSWVPLATAGERANAAILLALESEPVDTRPVYGHHDDGTPDIMGWIDIYPVPEFGRETRDDARWLVWC